MFKVLGINDESTVCECCGKTNLKRTVVLESESLGIVRYGVDCAGMALHGSKSAVNARKVVNAAKELARAEANRKAIAAGEESQRFIAFVATRSSKESHFQRILEIGGFSAAWHLFAQQG